MSTEREQLLKLESLYKEKKYNDFLPLAQEAVQNFPTSFHIHLLYGQALVDLKRYQDAEEILLELIKSYPDNINLLLELGKLFQLQQNKDQALEYFNRILFLDPFNSKAKQSIEQIDGGLAVEDIDISREQTEVELIIPEELTNLQPPEEEEEAKPVTPVPEDIPEQSFSEVLSEELEESAPEAFPEPVEATPEPAAIEIEPPPVESPAPEPEPPPIMTTEPAIAEPEPAAFETEPQVTESAETAAPEPVPVEAAIDPLAPTQQTQVPEAKTQPPTLDSDKAPPMDDTTPLDVIPLQEEQLKTDVEDVEDKVRQIAETEILQTIPSVEAVTATATDEEVKSESEAEFVTESAAEVYLQQGHVGEALKIYEQLYQSRKEEYIMEKINKLKIRYISQKKIDALNKFLDLIQQRS